MKALLSITYALLLISTVLCFEALTECKESPDLLITDVSFSDSEPLAGTTVEITFKVMNNGSSFPKNISSSIIRVTLVVEYLDKVETLINASMDKSTSPWLKGGTFTFHKSWTPLLPETYTFIFTVNEEPDSGLEQNETNNVFSKTIYVRKPAEIAIPTSQLKYHPQNPSPNDKVNFTIIVKNFGEEAVKDLDVTFYCNNILMKNVEVSIERNAFVTLNFTWIPPGYGTYNLKFHADSTNKITEENETNNIAEVVLVIEKRVEVSLGRMVKLFNSSYYVLGEKATGFQSDLAAASKIAKILLENGKSIDGRLDSEVANDISSNLIVIGGPKANRMAEKINQEAGISFKEELTAFKINFLGVTYEWERRNWRKRDYCFILLNKQNNRYV